MHVDVCGFIKVALSGRVPVAKLDAITVLADLEHLNVDHSDACRSLLSLRLLLVSTISFGNNWQLGLEFYRKLRPADVVLDSLFRQIGDQSSEELEMVARCEELRVVLDEVGAVLVHIELLPSVGRIFNLLAIFLDGVSTSNSFVLSVGIISTLSLFLALSVGLLIHKLLANSEVLGDLIVARHAALHPGVGADFVY